MSFFNSLFHGDDLSRLDEATAMNIAAQEGVQRAGEGAADSASKARRRAVVERRKTRNTARQIAREELHTSDVRALVEDMLTRPSLGGARGAGGNDLQ